MRYILLYTIGFFFLNHLPAQTLSELIKAFRDKDVAGITSQLDNQVEITVEGNNSTYNKQQASDVLTNFFRDNKMNNFKVLHQSENQGTAYVIASMGTSGGTYRVTLFTKEKSQRVLLQEIRIEK